MNDEIGRTMVTASGSSVICDRYSTARQKKNQIMSLDLSPQSGLIDSLLNADVLNKIAWDEIINAQNRLSVH